VGLSEAEEFDDDALKKLVNSKSKATAGANTSELDQFMVSLVLISENLG